MAIESRDRDGQRQCRDCGEWKTLEEFHASPRRPGGRGSYCKPCFNERAKASYARRIAAKEGRAVRQTVLVPEGHKNCADCGETKPLAEFPRNRSDTTGYATYCKPCHNSRGRESKTRLYGGTREYHLRRRYGMRQEDFEALLAWQGVCAPSAAHRTPSTLTMTMNSVTYVASCVSTATAVLDSSKTTSSHLPGRSSI